MLGSHIHEQVIIVVSMIFDGAVVADDGVACCAVEVQLNEICVVSVVDARDVLTRHRHRIISQT